MSDEDRGEEFARNEPNRFVLKPQREGGGNNIYRDDIPRFLDQLARQDQQEEQQSNSGNQEEEEKKKKKGKEGYILMELIEPPLGVDQVLLKAGQQVPVRTDVVSELGIYGITLLKERLREGEGGCEVLKNETVGHLLRTKARESDEGGIAVGFSVLDSPLLV